MDTQHAFEAWWFADEIKSDSRFNPAHDRQPDGSYLCNEASTAWLAWEEQEKRKAAARNQALEDAAVEAERIDADLALDTTLGWRIAGHSRAERPAWMTDCPHCRESHEPGRLCAEHAGLPWGHDGCQVEGAPCVCNPKGAVLWRKVYADDGRHTHGGTGPGAGRRISRRDCHIPWPA